MELVSPQLMQMCTQATTIASARFDEEMESEDADYVDSNKGDTKRSTSDDDIQVSLPQAYLAEWIADLRTIVLDLRGASPALRL